MSPELQQILDRLEAAERQRRGWKTLTLLTLVIAVGALAQPWIRPAPAAREDRARYSVVEADRFLLRDLSGRVRGGMEVDAKGAIKLVLGSEYGTQGAAFLTVQPDGGVQLALHGADGRVRAALTGGAEPALVLSGGTGAASAAVLEVRAGTGRAELTDPNGRVRFRAP